MSRGGNGVRKLRAWRKSVPTPYDRRCALLPHQHYYCPGCLRGIVEEVSTLEHVIPQSRVQGHSGVTLVYCFRCNNTKGAREPYGCELIWLFAVNARMGKGPTCMAELAELLKWRLRPRAEAQCAE